MDSKFLIQIRKIINSFNTSEVSDSDIYKLGKNYYKLNEQVTNAILRNQETGKIFLTSNLKQLKSEYEYIDLKIRLKLK